MKWYLTIYIVSNIAHIFKNISVQWFTSTFPSSFYTQMTCLNKLLLVVSAFSPIPVLCCWYSTFDSLVRLFPPYFVLQSRVSWLFGILDLHVLHFMFYKRQVQLWIEVRCTLSAVYSTVFPFPILERGRCSSKIVKIRNNDWMSSISEKSFVLL